ncbi:IS110 family transposase [Paenibacillus pinisoli]|uniref:IS110 family transposase n=1 Tax=Paenibacillus pinisoli TaxID=1276110 RepID=A0A3A6PKE1_9BACL|nr:IS110 family transposase [Paenibacillus pinisoli]RJX41795.1 IS110 family transposase [Paenibacillus pinisoli]
MEPVVGLDVSKGNSVVQAFLARNEVFGKMEMIPHDEWGYLQLDRLLTELRKETEMEPVIILEATGHYHRGLVLHLNRRGWRHIIINPLQSKRARGTQLRKVKTDAADAWHLAEMYYRGDVKPHRTWEEAYRELQHVTRQHEFITGMFVQAKLNARALLDQVFPMYTQLFRDIFSATSLLVLQRCLRGETQNMDKVFGGATGRARSKQWVGEKLNQLEHLLEDWMTHPKSDSQTKVLEGMIVLLLAFLEQLNDLEERMQQLASELPEVELVKSIPGVGDKLAATIIAEIGDAKQFKDPKQLVAYAGLDPGIFSSGKFTAMSSRITKRGSKRLRRALYLAVQCGLRRSANVKIKAYYDKKRKEGKPYKVVVIACANKLLHHVYAILIKGEPFKT